MKPKNILIISQAIYPHISPRSMRATELAKELARQGHNVTLYGVLGEYNYSTFEKNHNISVRNLGPTTFVKNNSDGGTVKSSSFFSKVMGITFNKLIDYPSIELAFKTYTKLKKETSADLLITIGSPHTIHWGAAYFKVKHKNGFPKTWVADCGDPYMGNPINKRPFYFKYIEKWFCKNVDYISIPVKEGIGGYYSEFHNKIKIIPQGFQFDNIEAKDPQNKTLTFMYAGVFYKDLRDPRPFLDYLITREDLDFLFIIRTKSKNFIKEYKKKLGVKIQILDYIPREQLLEEMSQMDFLVNFENNTTIQSPSKLIDYALVKRPILSLNTNRELEIKKIDQFLSKNYTNKYTIKDVTQYNITNVAEQFIKLT